MAEAIAFDLALELITKLSSCALSQVGLWWNLKHDIHDLKRTVCQIKAVLLDAEEKSVTDNLVKVWLEELKYVLYDADDLLDDFSTEALRKDVSGGNKLAKEVRLFFSTSNQFAYGLKMGRKMKAIKARLTSIEREANTFGFIPRDRPAETSFMTKRRQQTHSFEREDDIIGRDDDKAALLKLVLEFQSEENVYIIPIVGFGGLGKTALAQLVYNQEMVKNHFDLTMFACVSDDFDVKVIVANIIKSVTHQAPDQNLEMDQLQKQLRDKIDGKKYLLVLDDIWNEDPEKWSRLKKLLMGGAKGSRIIVTTRSLRVAEITNKCQSHVLKLKGLSDDDAWSLFKRIAFEQGYADSTNSAFVEVGRQISERCGGVPLAIRTIAGTLSLKKTANEWYSFKENELAKISQIEGELLPILKLSYDHLPSYLKHCFAYCQLYPKDYRIEVQALVQFWIAQGFIKQLNQSQSVEEIGFGYFKDLVERSFFQEVGERYSWEGLTCKMHDLMHDLAESVAGMESSIVDSNKIASDVGEKCRHISIKPSLIPLFKGKKLRTLLQYPNNDFPKLSEETWDFVIANCRCLRVLDLQCLGIQMISPSIYKLKHLRYLDLSYNLCLKILPKSICKIQNLLALKLDQCHRLQELPKNSRPLKQTIKMNINAKAPSTSTSSLRLSKLKSFDVHNIDGLDTHTLDECLQHLTSLERLTIRDWKEVDLEGMQWEPLKNLSRLEIVSIPKLVSLPIGLQHLTNLQGLYLCHLPNLTSLPDEMRCLTNLQILGIEGLPQLEERCRKDIGTDWQKIAHIPNIRLCQVGLCYLFILMTLSFFEEK
ncbi:hypothetical protein ERO13_D11G335350v2 [Gossypium hirsutum]|nr:hypothetical protein ERO13_D11G335350v2 [Gossypium hirsutum]